MPDRIGPTSFASSMMASRANLSFAALSRAFPDVTREFELAMQDAQATIERRIADHHREGNDEARKAP